MVEGYKLNSMTTHTRTQNSLTLKTASILEILSFGTDISFSNVRNAAIHKKKKNCNNEMRRQKAAGFLCSSSCSSFSRLPWLTSAQRGGHNPDPLAVPFSAHALRMADASQSECRHRQPVPSVWRRRRQKIYACAKHETSTNRFARSRAPARLPPLTGLPLCSVAKEGSSISSDSLSRH